MAKIYSLTYLRRLHKRKEALTGIKYYTKDQVFIGDENGYLVDITDVNHVETTDIEIKDINSNITTINTTINNLEESKADKCFTLAMAIVL